MREAKLENARMQRRRGKTKRGQTRECSHKAAEGQNREETKWDSARMRQRKKVDAKQLRLT